MKVFHIPINKALGFIVFFFFAKAAIGQKYYLGQELIPVNEKFELVSISSSTSVYSYKYIGRIEDKMFGRVIGSILVGIKDGHVATTIYNLVPEPSDSGIPAYIVDLVQKGLPYPLTAINGGYGINIDNTTIFLKRAQDLMTFGQDRIMYYSSVKSSLLTR